ncbi:uncharacterized protein LOC134227620 [Armigeres subalbatus]|uniref:uncharacterized protein LOC134227620 n=1 Tax=Armigeres subalbatus TaxID=124917 RepID=UPI002ED20260
MDDLTSLPPDADFRDRDTQKKFQGKQQEDARRRAKISEIDIGDTVLVKNLVPKDKLSTDFHKEKFLVVDKKGSNVTVQSEDNAKCYERNTSHLRKITEPSSSNLTGNQNEEQHVLGPHQIQPQHNSPSIVNESVIIEPLKDNQNSSLLRRSSRVPRARCRYSP